MFLNKQGNCSTYGKQGLTGFKAMRTDSKAEKPCLFPVLTIERTAANKSRPQSERNPFVTFLKMTLQRKACSLELLVGGMVWSSKNRDKFSRNSRHNRHRY